MHTRCATRCLRVANLQCMRTQLIALGAGILIGLGVSKYQARSYFDSGFQQAIASQDQACLTWWWGGDTAALERAKDYMCQTVRPLVSKTVSTEVLNPD